MTDKKFSEEVEHEPWDALSTDPTPTEAQVMSDQKNDEEGARELWEAMGRAEETTMKSGKPQRAVWLTRHDPLDEAYFPKLITAMQGITLGKVSIVTIRHDDWCPKLTGGPCRCDADVVVIEEGGV